MSKRTETRASNKKTLDACVNALTLAKKRGVALTCCEVADETGSALTEIADALQILEWCGTAKTELYRTSDGASIYWFLT